MSALQCGYCTAGMIVSAAALLATDPAPDEARIASALDGNVCRCCAYPRIVRAVRRAAGLPAEAEVTAPVPPGAGACPAGAAVGSHPGAERDWFAVLPEGLVVAVEPGPGAGGWSTSAGAWLHVPPTGR